MEKLFVIYSNKFLQYENVSHPESPIRVKMIYDELKNDSRFKFLQPEKVQDKDILSVHDKNLLEQVKTNSFYDADTPNIEDIYSFALLSAGSAQTAAKIALTKKHAFSLARPPGHHATKNKVRGFCYLNNMAIAVSFLLKKGIKVAILDLDVHHGNGTQDIFLGKENVFFCSLHQLPLYPNSGYQSEQNCYNFPIKPYTGIEDYLIKLDLAINQIKSFQAQILAISLGFDTFKKDPLAQLTLEIDDYRLLGVRVKKLQLPTFFVLEGGYSQEIGKCALSFFEGFLDR